MPPRSRHVVASYLVSGVLHTSLVIGLTLLTIRTEWHPQTDNVQTALRPAAGIDETAANVAIDPDAFQGVETAAVEASSAGLDALASADLRDPQLSEFARQRLEQARADAEDQSTQEQIADLESLGRQLTALSSSESVADVSTALAPLIGSGSERATMPDFATDDSVPFDLGTAQISAVLRLETEGNVQYVAVMVDAAGMTQEVPLDAADGESLYKVFELMKKFPLLETVYRKTVMGLLDRLMEEERSAESTNAPPSEKPYQPTGKKQSEQQD